MLTCAPEKYVCIPKRKGKLEVNCIRKMIATEILLILELAIMCAISFFELNCFLQSSITPKIIIIASENKYHIADVLFPNLFSITEMTCNLHRSNNA